MFVRFAMFAFGCMLLGFSVPALASDPSYPITVINTPETHLQFLFGDISGSRGGLVFCYTVTKTDGPKIDGFRTRVQFFKFDGTPVKLVPPYSIQENDDFALEPLKGGLGPLQGVYSNCWSSGVLAKNLGIEVSRGATFVVTSLHFPDKKPWVDVAIPPDTPGVVLPTQPASSTTTP